MATAVLDADYLSAYLGVPQQNITTAIDEPTAELVRSILQAVTYKAREHDELAADKLRVDIELENAVRSSETRVEGLRVSLEKSQKTVEEARTQLKEIETTKSDLESELHTLKSTSSTSTSDLETLRERIATLESANRDTVALLESKTTVNDNLSKELQTQHQKGLRLSQEITQLQQSLQTAESTVSSAKFKEQSLTQEIELAKRNNEWFENELKTKSADALKYRKEKGARIAELQRLNEEANANIEALKRTEQALRNRNDELQKKVEDSLSKVQQYQESMAQTEEGFRQQLESARRLGELQTQQAETHRNRLRQVEADLEKAKEDAAEQVGRCRQEVEAERQDREQAEHRVSELEAEIDRLEGQIASQPVPGSGPTTPRRFPNGSTMSRAGTPGSAFNKSFLSATEATNQLYKVRGELAAEKSRNQREREELMSTLEAFEAKQPEWEEMEVEFERLQREIVEMSKSVDQAGKERDRAKKEARMAASEASTALAEGNILRQQLRDLSAQVKMLLCDIDARDRGLDALSYEEREQLERLARGEIGEDAFDGLTASDRVISQRLTVFRNISELQHQNEELLKVTRGLSAQMESSEAVAQKLQAARDHEEVQKLQAKIENYKDELQSMITRSESYIKERDMFRRMLQHRGQLPPSSDLQSLFGQSVDGNQNGLAQSVEQTPGSKDNANYAVLLRELQNHFDQYREEQTTDRRTLKEQAERLASEKVSLQAEIAKINSQLTHANERYELFQSNYSMLQNENNELQKRSQTLSEVAAKQDLRTQQVAEDLVEAKGLIESMRNENANLKAEKTLWKDIQDRLNQENEDLRNDKTRLNNLVANHETLQNERELADSETRRRLQGQVDSLESELTTTKRKLNEEIEDNKKAQLRKEYDAQQNQKRIDDLASSLSQVREELIAAKTSRDFLQSRVDELTIELRSAEERVELLQPRPTPRPGAGGDSNGEVPEGDVNREQELALEVSELKRDLELGKSELESAREQVEQFKAISQAAEEELQSMNATQDQYSQEMERLIEEKESKIRELQQRVDDISAELTNTNNELTNLRNQQSEVARQFEEEKGILESEIARLKDEDERHATAAQFHQQDLRAQAAIATKAQQDYETELVKHAEAAKTLQTLRSEHNQLKTQTASLKADAESARVTLSQSESSWDQRRQQFEQELKELRASRDGLSAQNKLLNQQLDNVSSQISALQQRRTISSEAPGSPETEATPDRNLDGLRELNSYLRREKEIVEVQYDLKVQEAKRLQQQLEYSQSQLDESRLKLDQERRLNADGNRSSGAHKDLMEKLNNLNLLRESNTTLRNEVNQAQTQLAEKTKRVDDLLAQIQPLETKIREFEHNKETTDGEMRLLQEDRDRWQKRTQDIISKYDRIDPAEMEQLKENIETLKTERDELLAEKQPLLEQIQGFESEKAVWQQSRQKLVEQAKERNRTNTNAIKERTSERDAALGEMADLERRLVGLQQEYEVAAQEKAVLEGKVTFLYQELESIKSERDTALAKLAATPATAPVAPAPVQRRDSVTDKQLETLQKELDHAKQEKQLLEVEIKDLRDQLAKANSERDAAVAEAAEARSKQQKPAPDATMEESNEEGQINESSNTGVSDEERRSLEERIAAAEAKAQEQEEKATRIEEQMETTLKQRSDKMKAALNKKLVESKEQQKKEVEAEYNLKLEQEKAIWLAESKTAATPLKLSTDQPKAPGTPNTPATPNQNSTKPDSSLPSLSDPEIRALIQNNAVAQGIIRNNIKKHVATETQKLQDEHAKVMAETLQKAENAKSQAVMMETKKSALKLNMSENKSRVAHGKLEILQKAAQETPQKPVVEVWEVVKDYRPPPPPAAAKPSESAPPPNGVATKPAATEVKAEAPTPAVQAPAPRAATPTTTNGTQAGQTTLPPSNIPQAPHASSNIPRSGIPTMRGGPNNIRSGRGGGQLYQRGGGNNQLGRGRGGQGSNQNQRGGLNASAPPYSPSGPGGGLKRPRDEASMGGQQGHGGKRPRGGGPN